MMFQLNVPLLHRDQVPGAAPSTDDASLAVLAAPPRK